jgi:hypothetical protein
MKRLVALRETYHNGTRLAGDEFEANDQDAMVLVGIGHAKLAPSPAQTKTKPTGNHSALSDTPPKIPSVPDGDVEPVTAPLTTTENVLTQVRRRYKRRDMRSER